MNVMCYHFFIEKTFAFGVYLASFQKQFSLFVADKLRYSDQFDLLLLKSECKQTLTLHGTSQNKNNATNVKNRILNHAWCLQTIHQTSFINSIFKLGMFGIKC